MPEQDFELYLSLLSRFLRLKPAQRDEIADELRDHLEERLEELAARGLSRGEAIKAALDEFGDAAVLAQHFTQAAHIRRRRLIMRYTFGTVAALAASLLIAAAFWPESPQAPSPRNAVAQGFGGAGEVHKPGGISVATEDNDKAAVEAKLAKRIGEIDFIDVPLTDAIDHLSEMVDIDILLDRGALTDEGVALDQPVTLKVQRANPTARLTLELLLEPVKLSYTICDGLIMVTTTAQANQILVYNVRDLVGRVPLDDGAAPAAGMMGGWSGGAQGGGFFDASSASGGQSANPHAANGSPAAGAAAPGDQAAPAGPGMPGGMIMGGRGMGGRGMGGMGMGGGMPMGIGGGMAGMGGGGIGPVRQTHSLADLIATTIDPESWDDAGGNGSIVQYHELLVVKNSQTVHGKIKALLEMMRASARGEPGAAAPAATPAGAGKTGK
jgi:hypothetical protein